MYAPNHLLFRWRLAPGGLTSLAILGWPKQPFSFHRALHAERPVNVLADCFQFTCLGDFRSAMDPHSFVKGWDIRVWNENSCQRSKRLAGIESYPAIHGSRIGNSIFCAPVGLPDRQIRQGGQTLNLQTPLSRQSAHRTKNSPVKVQGPRFRPEPSLVRSPCIAHLATTSSYPQCHMCVHVQLLDVSLARP